MNSSTQIYAPNVHLFAFDLCDREDSRHLWNYYHQTIQTQFDLSPPLQIREAETGRRVDLWQDATIENIFLPLTGKLSDRTPITGRICPLLIYDSYALVLNLRIPEKDDGGKTTDPVNLEIFQQFNPDLCLCPEGVKSELGQTILLTAWLLPEQKDKKEEWEAIAQKILSKFLNGENCPDLYQSGQLFGSPIFEFGSSQYANENNKIEHYLVWLFLDGSPDENLSHFYPEFIDLFFYRNKITTTFQYSRSISQELKQNYSKIRETFSKISKQFPDPHQTENLSTQELEKFKQDLRTLPKLDLEYTESLNHLKGLDLTIEINHYDYTEKLARIQEKMPQSDLIFLAIFNRKISPMLQHRIKDDRGYFDRGSHFVDKAIATIRGLVEIEQAKSDRQRQQAEKERDRKEQERYRKAEEQARLARESQEDAEKDLQDNVQAIGVGIAVGAIIASSSGLMTQPITWPSNKERGQYIHPFLIAVLGSLGVAAIAWKCTKWILQKWRSHNKTDS
ncbi:MULTISPECIES: hypothetical protein [Spirulina sp. CCY15215]|uniref:hypothetical protein n=1 Tax=Spirulina sp. CCY15215 TaxID=2767591 RepID=UPI00194E03F9|nr:hypothetical protein [Spirulina major]